MADTIPARLRSQGKRLGQRPAYYVRQGGSWRATNWRDYAAEVRAAGKALLALGLGTDSKVAILGFNRPEWVVMDVATMSIGGAPAGIYTTCSPVEVRYIIEHSEAPVVLLENADQWKKVEAELGNMPNLKHAVMMKGDHDVDHEMVLSWEQFLAKGADVSDADFDAAVDALEPDQLATLIYTSGTTGPPKGVMLSHNNLSFTANTAVAMSDLQVDDCAVSYLPLSHIAEQMFSIHSAISAGYQVYFAESIEALADNVKDVQPTIFFGVPRIWEKFHAGVSAKMKEATGAKAKLVAWAMGVGKKVTAQRMRGRDLSLGLSMEYALAKKLIYSKVKPAIGLGRARFCVTGAAPISAEILEFFAGLDLTILEVYGQSEDTGPTSFNLPDRAKFGTVGPAIPGVEVEIAEDGEICVSGPNVFLGYFKDEDATADALSCETVDGKGYRPPAKPEKLWLHSGDLGQFDSEGFLNITGRKKDIIITAGGKNVTPKNIESGIKNHELVAEAVVIGDRRKYLTALVTLDPEALERAGYAVDAHADPKIRDSIQTAIDAVNRDLAKVETIKKFAILERPFSIEDGELTPTLKVKRQRVNDNFAEVIESLYG